MKYEYQVAIPSYQRAMTLRDKTLPLLAAHSIPASLITVFVANKEEEAEYARVLVPSTYGKIRIGQLTLRAQWNFMLDHYKPGTRVFHIDDDIIKISQAIDRKTLVESTNLREIIEEGWAQCEEKGLRLWGMYPVHNAYFMRPTITYALKHIIGCLQGYIVDGKKDSPLRVTLPCKLDLERSCNCYDKDGGVVRFNYVAMLQHYLKEPGGMQADGPARRTEEHIRYAAKTLTEMFPAFATMNTRKKSGIADVVLRDSRR